MTGQESQAEGLFKTWLTNFLSERGYELVDMQLQTGRQKVLRLFIDYLDPKTQGSISIEDCVRMTRELDEPLDQKPEVEALFRGPYELEVSSPGLNRPLRKAEDFERFSGKEARIHLFRPLTVDEIGNAEFQSKHPKQKSFYGLLKGVSGGSVLVSLLPDPEGSGKGKKKKTAEPLSEVKIPLGLISKSNLEPKFDFSQED